MTGMNPEARAKWQREQKWTLRLGVANVIAVLVLLLVLLAVALIEADLGTRACERAEQRERKALMLADWSGHPADVADAAEATDRRIRRCDQASGQTK